MMKYFRCASGVVLSLILIGCSHQVNKPNAIKKDQSTPVSSASTVTKGGNVDPFEKYNRVMFKVNTSLNNTVFEPVVDIYDKSVPAFGREIFHNFFSNIQMFPTIGNDLLQANFRWAGRDFMRLVLNSSLGGLGLIDVASSVGLYSRSQSFGLTLGKWGVQETPYLVLPVLGPSTVRGAIGLVPDFYMTPINYLPKNREYWILKGFQYVQIGSDVLPKVRFIMDNSLDPYIAMRNAYTQNQHYLLEQVREERESVEAAGGAVQLSPTAEGDSHRKISKNQNSDLNSTIESPQGASQEAPEVV
jgi:phospholipid-binding lipoprotein MlaA